MKRHIAIALVTVLAAQSASANSIMSFDPTIIITAVKAQRSDGPIKTLAPKPCAKPAKEIAGKAGASKPPRGDTQCAPGKPAKKPKPKPLK
ncbi:hypothetical protein ACOI1H_16175 [Loktanella sp. DJP18]|uniref:hypothetical protein n=1 Tax=Loktanella sp. DJP18 TaxID=3409788 RepID=UPI003BB49D08